MQYSGIVVTTRAGSAAAVAARLESMPGVEVYLRDDPSGRIIVVQEADEVEVHEDLFRRIQALPEVVATELVCHVADPEPMPPVSGPPPSSQEAP